MFASHAVHYKNKFPKCQVKFDDMGLDVYSSDGKHLVAVRKTGAGSARDVSKELGCFEEHDLSPIPRETRCYKLNKDGTIGMDEEYRERRDFVKAECVLSEASESKIVTLTVWGGYKVEGAKEKK